MRPLSVYILISESLLTFGTGLIRRTAVFSLAATICVGFVDIREGKMLHFPLNHHLIKILMTNIN